MDLKSWLLKKKIAQVEFARQIGINSVYLNHIIVGKRYAGYDLAATIEKATNGKVKAKDLIRPPRHKVPCPTCGRMYIPKEEEKKGKSKI